DAFLKSSRGRSHPQLAVRIDYYLSARHCHARNACNESAVLRALSADPDLIGLAGGSERTDIDVVTAGGEIGPGRFAQRDVADSRRVIRQRLKTAGRVVVADRVRFQSV